MTDPDQTDGESQPADGDAGAAGDRAGDHTGVDTGGVRAEGRREVVVPMRLYKTVTVFSTLVAVVCVVGGFALLDVATQRASAPPEQVNVPLALLGLGLIATGGAVYAYATRFRAAGMGESEGQSRGEAGAGKGNDKTPADEPDDDG